MMRYVILVKVESLTGMQWSFEVLEQRLRHASRLWTRVYTDSSTRIFCIDNGNRSYRSHTLLPDRGVVLGTLFEYSDSTTPSYPRARAVINADESRRIVESGGKRLVERYWGSYVAVLKGDLQYTTRILCSPMSTLPCLVAESSGLYVHFSDLRDLLALRLLNPSINWRLVAAHLTGISTIDETGLNEVKKVDGGECIEYSKSAVMRHRFWNPSSIACSKPVNDFNEAAITIRETTKACVHAWASCFSSVMVSLSGGLDSSIVLSCLQDAPIRTRIVAANAYSAGSDNDERGFARLAASRARCELLEVPRNLDFDIDGVFEASPLERPRPYLHELSQRQVTLQLAQRHGVQAIMGGDGGDEVYLNAAAKFAVADLLRRWPTVNRLLDSIWTAARLESVSVWKVILDAVYPRLPYARVQLPLSTEISPLLNWDLVRALLDRQRPTRYGIAPTLTPGKQVQLFRLLRYSSSCCAPSFSSPEDPEGVAPLLSQPLVELSLRIPTYVLIARGWDRAVARKAFEKDVPQEIIRRRWKGSQDNYTAEIFRRYRDFIRRLLLDGILVREGLLNRERVDLVLSPTPSGILRGTHPLSRHLSLEIWLRILEKQGVTVGVPRQSVVSAGATSPLLFG